MSNDKLDLILNQLQSMQTDMNSMKADINSLQTETLSIRSDMDIIKSQLDENTQLTKAIYHRQEEFEAKFQGEIVAISEKVSQVAAGQRAISGLIGEHEIAIRTIRNPI